MTFMKKKRPTILRFKLLDSFLRSYSFFNTFKKCQVIFFPYKVLVLRAKFLHLYYNNNNSKNECEAPEIAIRKNEN